jgi:hypothetical protein
MVHRAANGQPARRNWPVKDHMAELRARNGRARRQD